MGYYKDYLFDTAITWTTDGANAGTVSYRSGKFYSTNVNGVLISDKGYANKAISEILNLEAWKWVSHVGNPKLMNNVMGDISIMIPSSFEEQDRLSDFLNQLDDTIALHEEKKRQLEHLKSALLQKMFANKSEYPAIRFEGFSDEWKSFKLSSLATMHARIGWQNLRTSEFLSHGKYMLITGTDFKNGQINFSTCHYVEKERYEQDKHIQIKNGSILITKDGTLGKVAYVQRLSKPATLNAGIFNIEIRNENEIDRTYLFQYLKAPFLMNYVQEKATGGTIKHLNQSILKSFPVQMPNKIEQNKIGELITKLDHLINLQRTKLNDIAALKNSLLQSMFI